MKRKPLVEYIRKNAEIQPDKVAFYSKGDSITYLELWKLVVVNAGRLKKAGVQRQEPVLVITSQNIFYIIAYFAVQLAGAVFTPLSKEISKAKIHQMMNETGARFIIGSEEKQEDLFLFSVERDCNDEQEIKQQEFPSLQMEDVGSILFTTGTTGEHKGVMLTHKNLAAVAENLIGAIQPSKDDMILVASPLNHANALRKIDMCVMNGSSAVLEDGFLSWDGLLSSIKQYHVSSLCLPPSAARMLFLFGKQAFLQAHLKLDYIESATAPLQERDKEELKKIFPGARLYNNYGSTESGSACIYEYSTGEKRRNCIGLPTVNSSLAIMDEEGNIISSDREHIGYIACRGEMNMKGYWRDEKASRDAIVNGYVRSKDMGYMDKDGFVYVLGREQDVINVGGEKVNPEEIEEAAFLYDEIQDCGCARMNHRILGEVPYLYVVPKAGYQENELRLILEAELEKYKQPYRIVKRKHIPRTYNGKILRRQLGKDMAGKKLPIHTPVVDVYIHHAFPVSVLPENLLKNGWIHGRFISLEYIIKSPEEQYLDYPYYDFFADDDVFIKGFYWLPFRTKKEKQKLIGQIRECIDHGEYIHASWNEKYIPDTEFYQKRDFTHSCFIYGYNDEKSIFYTVNYLADMQWHEFEVDYDCFLHAVLPDKDREPKGYIGFEAYRKSPVSDKEFDYEQMKKELHRFIFTRKKRIGINAGRAFLRDAGKTAEKGEYIPRQSVYILYEHLSRMMERFTFLNENGYTEIDLRDIKQLDVLREDFRLCIRLWLKYHLRQETETIRRMCQIADAALKEERKILKRIWKKM